MPILKLIIRRTLRFLTINIFPEKINSYLHRLPYSRFYKICFYLVNGIEEVEYFGVKVAVNPGDIQGYYLYFFNDYENEYTKKLIKLCENKKVFFDVGANFGWISQAIANNTNKLKVYAFEPDKNIARQFIKNLESNTNLNSKIRIINKAVYDSETEVCFSPSKSAHNPGVGRIDSGESSNDKIETISLDSFCSRENIYPDIVKIDVEGAELKVIKGMKKMLSRGIPDYILVETHGFYFKDKTSEFNAELIDELITNHYKIYLLEGDKVSPFNEEYKKLDRMHLLAKYKTA